MNLRYSSRMVFKAMTKAHSLNITAVARGRFEDDFKRTRTDLRRRTQYAIVGVADDAIARRKPVNDRPPVAGQEFLGGL